MADNKVKISHILDNLIPEFISTDNPLFVDFLKSYYISEEREYGSIYLIDHLSSFKNISTFADLIIGAKNQQQVNHLFQLFLLKKFMKVMKQSMLTQPLVIQIPMV